MVSPFVRFVKIPVVLALYFYRNLCVSDEAVAVSVPVLVARLPCDAVFVEPFLDFEQFCFVFHSQHFL